MVYSGIIAIATLLGIGVGVVLTPSTLVSAQTPTTSDLPATIGNESALDMGLTNNSLPVQNTTTIYAAPPV
jgi:hypothetical protein